MGGDPELRPFAADYADERRWGKTYHGGTEKSESQPSLKALAEDCTDLEEQRSRFPGPHRSYAGIYGSFDVRLSEQRASWVGGVKSHP